MIAVLDWGPLWLIAAACVVGILAARFFRHEARVYEAARSASAALNGNGMTDDDVEAALYPWRTWQ